MLNRDRDRAEALKASVYMASTGHPKEFFLMLDSWFKWFTEEDVLALPEMLDGYETGTAKHLVRTRSAKRAAEAATAEALA